MTCRECAYEDICDKWKNNYTKMKTDARNGVCDSFGKKSCVIELPCKCEIFNKEIQVLITYARNNMKISKTAKALKTDYHTVCSYLSKAKEKYGLDPKNLFDLCKILSQIYNDWKGVENG